MYFVHCEDAYTREGWLEEFNTLEEALSYIKENFDCACNLIKGEEIEFIMKDGILEVTNGI